MLHRPSEPTRITGQVVFRQNPDARFCATGFAARCASNRKQSSSAINSEATHTRKKKARLSSRLSSILIKRSGFRRILSSRKSRRRPQFRPHHLGIRAGRSLRRRRRRRPNFLRQRLVLHQQLHFVGVNHFALQQRQTQCAPESPCWRTESPSRVHTRHSRCASLPCQSGSPCLPSSRDAG